MHRADEVWKNRELVRTFLDGVRGGVPYAADQLDIMLRVLTAHGTLRNIMDLGCGSGVLARSIVTQHRDAHVTLVDFSDPMLAAAKDLWSGYAPVPRFVAADLARSAWVDHITDGAPFDAIVSGYAIHHLTDARKRELYAEIFTLLAPHGMFVNVEHVASATPWIESLSDALIIDSLHAFHARQGSDRTREQIAHEFVHRPDKAANILAPVETQCDWLRGCGFVDVDCYFKVFELAVFGGCKPVGSGQRAVGNERCRRIRSAITPFSDCPPRTAHCPLSHCGRSGCVRQLPADNQRTYAATAPTSHSLRKLLYAGI